MTTRYPNAIDGYSQIRTVKDKLDEIIAADHNDVRSAVLAIEQTLGLKPQGIYGTVVNRLESLEGDLEDHYKGLDLRHTDGHIDAAAKTGSPYSLSLGTVQTQLSALINDINLAVRYGGSTPDAFADGYALPASFVTSAITETVRRLGDKSAGVSGTSNIGYDGSGNNWADGTGLVVDELDDTLDSIVSTLGAATGTSKIGYDGSGNNWADGTGLAVGRLDNTLDSIVSSIGAAGGSEKVGIDSSGWIRLNGPGVPTSVQLALNRVDAYMDSIYDEVEAARGSAIFSPTGGFSGGTFTDLAGHLDSIDTHSRFTITCSDGVLSSGGMFDGPDALFNAIVAIDSLSADEYGGIILLRAGTYVIDLFCNIYNSIQIIGIEDNVIIRDDLDSTQWLITLRGAGSSIRNVEFAPGLHDHRQHLRIEADHCIVEQVTSDGTFAMGVVTANADCVIRNCDFGKPSGSPVDSLIIGSLTDGAVINECIFNVLGHNVSIDAYGAWLGRPNTIRNCFFTAKDNAMSIMDHGGGGTLLGKDLAATIIYDCQIWCQPATADRPVVSIAGDSAKIDGLQIDVVELIATGGYIASSILDVQGKDFSIKNVNINFGASSQLLSYGEDNNPLIFVGSGVVDGLIVSGGGLPTSGDAPGALSLEYPLIWAAGSGALDAYGVVHINNAHITCPTDTGTVGVSVFSLLGDKGSSGVAVTAYGWIELDNVVIMGEPTSTWDNADSKYMIANVQENTRIHDCSFVGGSWSSMIVAVDVHDVQIFNNRFERSTNLGSQQIIWIIGSAGPVFRSMINDNNIVFDDLDKSSGTYGAITLTWVYYGTVNNNVVVNTSTVDNSVFCINLDTNTEMCVVIGNNLHTPDSSADAINDSGSGNKYEITPFTFDLNLLTG